MGQRANHYAAAFEEYLRHNRIPYVLVDEQRRSLLRQASLKSMDFIVYSERRPNLLIDVKGRKFPSGTRRQKWVNWATEDDLHSLAQWQEVFGADFRALLVFAYHIIDRQCAADLEPRFAYRDEQYAFFGIWVDEYRTAMRIRSQSWKTVALPNPVFRRLCAPVERFL